MPMMTDEENLDEQSEDSAVAESETEWRRKRRARQVLVFDKAMQLVDLNLKKNSRLAVKALTCAMVIITEKQYQPGKTMGNGPLQREPRPRPGPDLHEMRRRLAEKGVGTNGN